MPCYVLCGFLRTRMVDELECWSGVAEVGDDVSGGVDGKRGQAQGEGGEDGAEGDGGEHGCLLVVSRFRNVRSCDTVNLILHRIVVKWVKQIFLRIILRPQDCPCGAGGGQCPSGRLGWPNAAWRNLGRLWRRRILAAILNGNGGDAALPWRVGLE